jgi:translation initiation factor IF-1
MIIQPQSSATNFSFAGSSTAKFRVVNPLERHDSDRFFRMSSNYRGKRPSGGNRPPQRSSGGRGGGYQGGGPRRPAPEPEEDDLKQKEEAIELEGTIAAVLAGTMFRVRLKNGHEVLAHISGKMRKKFIRLVIGDNVKIEMSPYDSDKARIVYRL